MRKFFKYFNKKYFEYFVDLVTILTKKELKVRYKSSFLGYIWSVALPLASAVVYFFAFKVIMRIQMNDYALFLIAGLFPWQWFANTVNFSASVFLSNSGIIKKVNFPRSVLMGAAALNDAIHFWLSIPVILLFTIMYGKSPSLVWIPGVLGFSLVQYIMTFGIGLCLGSINLFFRDLERIVSIGIMILFYVTPIFYPLSMIPSKYHFVFYCNPIGPLIEGWKELFLKNHFSLLYLAISFGFSLICLGIGLKVFDRLKWKFAEVL